MSFRRSAAIVAALSVMVAACGGPSPSIDASGPSRGAVSPAVTSDATSPGASPSVATSPMPRACSEAPAASQSGDEAPWWTEAVFYEVFVRSFADSDGDGIGDLRGLIDRLDHLNDGDPSTSIDLGVTALWLMPVAASPSYHGYDVVDYLTIEPDLGTNDDFRELVDAAEARGMRIIVDLVMNHSSVEHPWFQEARERGSEREDWYVWADERPAVSGPAGRPVWHEVDGRWYYGYFWDGMPDLNVANPEVAAELDAIAAAWLTEMGAAGFRLDAARHLIEDGSELENTPATFDWLEGFRSRVHEVDADALVLGEVWDATSMAARYVREGALDLTFDFGLASQMLQAVRTGDAGSLRIIQDEVTAAYPAGGYAAFLTNHDQDRTFDVVGRDEAAARQAATLLLTNPGVPFLYYGEEVGLRGRKPDERIRTPMPWTGAEPGFGFTDGGAPWQPMAEDVADRNVAAMDADPASLLSHYRSLLGQRRAHPALAGAAPIVPLDASARGVYAVLRHDPVTGRAAVVVSNLTDEPVEGITLTTDEGPLCGSVGVEILFRAGVPAAGNGAAPAPLAVTGAGGFEAWAIGNLGPHEDLIIDLMPSS